MANFYGPKRDYGHPIPLIYFALQVTDPKKLKAEGEGDKIWTATRNAPTKLGIDPAKQFPQNNFQKLPQYAHEPLLS